MKQNSNLKLIVGVSGASGVIYGVRLLSVLKEKNVETHLILSQTAEDILKEETPYSVKDVKELASFVYENDNFHAALASGSFQTSGMVVAPCSIKSLSGIANSYNDSLLTRAADVTLKERRKLVLVVRETPLHKGHIKLMEQAIDLGAVILPPIPAFYFHPKTLDNLINHTVGKILDQFCISHNLFKRWGSNSLTRSIHKR